MSKSREAARQEIPEPLRRDVRLLGRLLGDVIADYGGAKLLRDVEQLRALVIRGRDDGRYESAAEKLVASWPLKRAELVARAFACYFHLANLAEEHHRARVLRERDRGPAPQPESIAATVRDLGRTLGRRKLDELIAELRIHPVFTAHPTEARRRAVVTAIRRIGEQLMRLDDPGVSESDRVEAQRRLSEEIDSLWRTAQLRNAQVGPLDFDRHAAVQAPLDRFVDLSGRRPVVAPAFVRLGSWIGGDRDGNPAVTAKVTAAAMTVQTEHVLLALEAGATRIGRALTVEAATTPPSPALRRRLAAAHARDPKGVDALSTRSADEPHRVFLLHVADRIHATRIAKPVLGYSSPAGLLEDLRAISSSLAASGASRLAFGELQNLIWQAETFGFHLAELEVRQHSTVHERALAEIGAGARRSDSTREVLKTLAAMSALQARFGGATCRRYVVSFARDAADVAAVYELAEHAAGDRLELDVVPLFETLEDLARATSVMDGMLKLSPVRRRLAKNGRRLEVMLGYSDSAKEAGPLSATLALHDAQAQLTAWAAKNRVRLVIFHGRGGALGRGGGPANRAVRAQAPGSVAGYFKVTEQGEVIFARYGNQSIARRHLEQVTSAVLEASAHRARTRDPAVQFGEVASRIGGASHTAYRKLVEAPGFDAWFAKVSPIEELGRLRIASRPTRRATGTSIDDLRAIPWVFAWSQMRLNLPAWYGIGSGLSAAPLADLRRAYAKWPLFNVMLDNAEMSLAKTDRRIAQRYLDLGDRPDLTAMVLKEYDRTLQRVLAVTGHTRLLEDRRVLSWAIELRNPYVDALSHLQLRALRALRNRKTPQRERERAERVFQLSVNGVAAGLQNTG